MKKLCFLVIAVTLFSASRIQAQGLHLGIKGGVNFSDLSGRSFDGSQAAYNVGAFAEINATSKWGIQPEVMFSQTRTKTVSNFSSIVPTGLNSVDVNLNYLSIPILLTYKLPIPVLSLQLGPQFGILMNKDQTVLGNGKSAFKSGDFSMVGGVQLNLLKFKAGARYVLGLTDINDINDADTWKNRNFQIYIGFRLF